MGGIIAIKDGKYPKLLKEIGKDAPKQLYYKGDWRDEIFENCLAVVGSRQMTVIGHWLRNIPIMFLYNARDNPRRY